MTLRVAIDANVLITGIVWPRWQHAILLHALEGDFSLVLSPFVIDEARRRVGETFPDHLERFEWLLLTITYELAPKPSPEECSMHNDLVRQAKDVPIALSIRDAHVDYFITYDRDFTDQDETTAKVRQAIPGIVLPPVFLRDVMGWTSQELEQIRYREWTDLQSG